MQACNNESGRSLIEMLAVIGIISVITVGAISGMQYGVQTFRANSAFDLVETAARDVLDLFSWRSDLPMGSDFSGWICSNDIVDNCATYEKSAFTSTAWGDMEIYPQSRACFQITLTNVPERGCELLSNMTWRYAQHGTCDKGSTIWSCDGTQKITFFVE